MQNKTEKNIREKNKERKRIRERKEEEDLKYIMNIKYERGGGRSRFHN